MSPGNGPPSLAKLLRDRDEALWRQVEDEVLPRVLAALRRRFGPGRHWHDLEGFARSAQRVALRLLAAGRNTPLEELESLAQLEGWLVRVAAHKFSDAVRRADRELAHAPRVLLSAEGQEALAELGNESVAAVLAELESHLHDETDRAVFRG